MSAGRIQVSDKWVRRVFATNNTRPCHGKERWRFPDVCSVTEAPDQFFKTPTARTTALCETDPLQTVFSVASRPRRPHGLLGTGSQGHPPRPSHSSWALREKFTTDTWRNAIDGEPRTATSTFTRLLNSVASDTAIPDNYVKLKIRPTLPCRH